MDIHPASRTFPFYTSCAHSCQFCALCSQMDSSLLCQLCFISDSWILLKLAHVLLFWNWQPKVHIARTSFRRKSWAGSIHVGWERFRKVFPCVGTGNVASDQKECDRTYVGDLELFLYWSWLKLHQWPHTQMFQDVQLKSLLWLYKITLTLSAKCLPHEDKIDVQDPKNNSGMAAHTCNTRAGKAETTGLAK